MTPDERVAAEALANAALQHLVVAVVLVWWTLWAWERLKLPTVDWRKYWTWQPRKTIDTEPADNMTEDPDQGADHRTDERTDRAQSPDAVLRLLQVDRTRKGAVKAFVRAGWSVAQIRSVVKGENAVISQEITAAKADLEEGPQLVIRDGQGERLISR